MKNFMEWLVTETLVMVNKRYLGKSTNALAISSLRQSPDGPTGIFFTTQTGNEYLISYMGGKWYLRASHRENAGFPLTAADVASGIVKINKPFIYQDGRANTSPVTSVYAVNMEKEYPRDQLIQWTGGHYINVRF
jgi:hypothetical protein